MARVRMIEPDDADPETRRVYDGVLRQWADRIVRFITAPERNLDLPLDIRGTAFQARVWRALQKIPLGKTASYAEIAAKEKLDLESRNAIQSLEAVRTEAFQLNYTKAADIAAVSRCFGRITLAPIPGP